MKIYISDFEKHAGKWIYQGYQKAWASLGFEVIKCDTSAYPKYVLPEPQPAPGEEYMVMLTEYDAQLMHDAPGIRSINLIANSTKTFLFVQPSRYPEPWAQHPNFTTCLNIQLSSMIKQMDNVYPWTFADARAYDFYPRWEDKINTVPLAFDSIGYTPTEVEKYKQFDISFVGGWADNGFDEKRKIMMKTFAAFKDSGLKCGFFINKNLSHQQECDLLANSKMTINVHDAYQRTLGTDTNERTYKSLGLNGLMISDTVKQLNDIFPSVRTTLEPSEMVTIAKEILSLPESEIDNIKEVNRENILKNHCYINRAQAFLDL